MFRKSIIFIPLLLIFCLTAAGQSIEKVTNPVSITASSSQEQTSIPSERKGTGFNAMNYTMQKRTRATGTPFISEKFSDHTYIIAGVGADILYPRGGYHYSLGKAVTLGYGKWVNPYNAVRLTMIGNNFARKEDNAHLLTGSFYFSHLFNFISYLGGYNLKRPFEMSTVAGVGYNLTYLKESLGHSFGAHLGLNFEIAFSEYADFFLEPLVTFYTDQVDLSGDLNWHKYDLGFSAAMGVNIKFDSNRKVRVLVEKDAAAKEGRSYFEGMFVTLMTGGQFQNSTLVHKEVGLVRSIGQHTGLSIGKWFGRGVFALRGTAFFSNDKWNQHDDIIYPARYMGLRAEAMLDLMNLFSRKEDRVLSLPVMAGPEIGYMNKKDYQDNNLNRYYIGLAAGMQVNFLLAKHLDIFFEPKFSMVPYSIVSDTYMDNIKKTTDYFDGLVSLSFGVGYKF